VIAQYPSITSAKKIVSSLPAQIVPGQPPCALAPMQDITNWTFLKIMHEYGNPDYYFNEYFRVHEQSILEPHILRAIAKNPTDRPIFAQFMGEHLPSMGKAIHQLKRYPIAGIDLNMGCPVSKVYKKNVGGGLLRDLRRTQDIFEFLRENVTGIFTVKCRLGFENSEMFDLLLDLVNQHDINHLSIHGRTVKQLYRGEVDYERIRYAVGRVNCTVFANGNITSAKKALEVLAYTGSHGVMIGRSAVRNPWIFRQYRELLAGKQMFQPTLGDVREYIEKLYKETLWYNLEPLYHANVLKKFLNFISQSVDANGDFQYAMRRSRNTDEMRTVCDQLLLGSNADKPFADEPYDNVHARTNHECNDGESEEE